MTMIVMLALAGCDGVQVQVGRSFAAPSCGYSQQAFQQQVFSAPVYQQQIIEQQVVRQVVRAPVVFRQQAVFQQSYDVGANVVVQANVGKVRAQRARSSKTVVKVRTK